MLFVPRGHPAPPRRVPIAMPSWITPEDVRETLAALHSPDGLDGCKWPLPDYLEGLVLTLLDPQSTIHDLAMAIAIPQSAQSLNAGISLPLNLTQFMQTREGDLEEIHRVEPDWENLALGPWWTGKSVEFLLLTAIYPNTLLPPLSREALVALLSRDPYMRRAVQAFVPAPLQRVILAQTSMSADLLASFRWSFMNESMVPLALRSLTTSDLSGPAGEVLSSQLQQALELEDQDRELFTSVLEHLPEDTSLQVADVLRAVT